MSARKPEPEDPSPADVREPYAGGDCLVRHPADSELALTIEAAFEKPGWRPRTPETMTSIAHPGTAIQFEDSLYEIVGAEPAPGAGAGVCYHLKRWDDAYTIRRIVAYTREDCRRLAAERTAERRDARIGLPLLLLTPFIGLLPAEDQRRIERRYGVGSRLATLASALLLLFAGGVGFISFLAGVFAPGFGASGASVVPWPYQHPLAQLLAIYFLVESMVRFGVCLSQDRPIGSLPVALGLELVRAIRARR